MTRVGPQEQRIGVMQPLPWFGKLKAAGDVASADAAAVLADMTALQLQIIREIKDVWYELAWLGEAQRWCGSVKPRLVAQSAKIEYFTSAFFSLKPDGGRFQLCRRIQEP